MRELLRDKLALVILSGALLLRLAFFHEVRVHELDLSGNDQLDMIFLHENAKRIAAGDLALRDPFFGHYEDVRTGIYGAGRYDRLYGVRLPDGTVDWKRTYVDSPGYLYFAGLCERAGGSPYAVVLVQLVLDALGCAFVYILARRTFGLATARVAIAASALCLECVAEAGFVLRESFVAFLATASVLSIDGARRSGRTRDWALAGLAFGCAWITKLTFSIFLPVVPLVAWLEPDTRGEASEPRRRACARRLAAFALAFVLPVLPFAARNVALGVPPLRMSTLALPKLATCNMKGYPGCAEYLRHDQTHAVIERSGDTLLGTWLAAVRSHDDPVRDYPALEARKLHYFWLATDFWNNIRCSYLRLLSPSLGLCVVSWGVLGPWTAIGLALVLASPRRRRTALPIVGAFLTVGLATALSAGVYTRYRMVVAPMACILFAVAVVDAARLLAPWSRKMGSHEHDRTHQAALGAAIVFAGVILHVVLRDPQPPLTKPALVDYIVHTWSKPSTVEWLLGRAEASGAPDGS